MLDKANRICIYLVCSSLCFVSNITKATETNLHRYALHDHGSIHLKVPISWKDQLQQPANGMPPTIAFRPKSGPLFEVLTTPLWATSKNEGPITSEKIKQIVQKGAERAQTRSVEKTIHIVELGETPNQGYYFRATDRTPEPEGYKYMIQGTICVGELMVMFTILTNEGQDKVVVDALSMLKSAIHVKGNAT